MRDEMKTDNGTATDIGLQRVPIELEAQQTVFNYVGSLYVYIHVDIEDRFGLSPSKKLGMTYLYHMLPFRPVPGTKATYSLHLSPRLPLAVAAGGEYRLAL